LPEGPVTKAAEFLHFHDATPPGAPADIDEDDYLHRRSDLLLKHRKRHPFLRPSEKQLKSNERLGCASCVNCGEAGVSGSAHVNKCLSSFRVAHLSEDDPVHRHTHPGPNTFTWGY